MLTQRVDPQQILAEAKIEFRLTKREVDVLHRLLCGMRTAEIATTLYIAPSTVAAYEQRLLQKTASSHRSEMVAKVLGWHTA